MASGLPVVELEGDNVGSALGASGELVELAARTPGRDRRRASSGCSTTARRAAAMARAGARVRRGAHLGARRRPGRGRAARLPRRPRGPVRRRPAATAARARGADGRRAAARRSTWAVLTPAFQAPDEQSHFAYTQYLAETRSTCPGDPATADLLDRAHPGAALAVNADQLAGQRPSSRPSGVTRLYRALAARPTRGRHARRRRRRPLGQHATRRCATSGRRLGYRLARGRRLLRPLFGARLFSALWLPITVSATWLLAGELFGRRRLLQLAAAAVPALLPMCAFVSGSVSPDGMLFALWTLALWLGVRILRRGLTAARRRRRSSRVVGARVPDQGDELRAAARPPCSCSSSGLRWRGAAAGARRASRSPASRCRSR